MEKEKVFEKRRKYTPEFKEEAIKLVVDGGMSKAEVGRRLGVTATTVAAWMKDMAPEGRLVDLELREQVRRQAEEIRQLKMERDILKKATAFFASQK